VEEKTMTEPMLIETNADGGFNLPHELAGTYHAVNDIVGQHNVTAQVRAVDVVNVLMKMGWKPPPVGYMPDAVDPVKKAAKDFRTAAVEAVGYLADQRPFPDDGWVAPWTAALDKLDKALGEP
jgi:hypothetical protein